MRFNDKQGGGLTDAEIKEAVDSIDFGIMVTADDYIYVIARAIEQEVLARVAPSVPEGYRLQPLSEFDAMLNTRTIPTGYRIVSEQPDSEYAAMLAVMEQSDPANFPGLTVAQRCALGRFAAPQPSEKQVEPESPMKVAADALRRKAELEQAHQDGYRDGFKAAQAMLDKAEQAAEEARGVDALRIFKERLDELRDHDVSAAFHEIVAAARALLADPARCEQSAAATAHTNKGEDKQ